MQPQKTIEACRALYSTSLPASDKLEAIGVFLGVGVGATGTQRNAVPVRNRTPAATRQPATAKAAQPARARGRPRTTAAKSTTAAAAAPAFGEKVYALIPETGGIAQTQIKLRGSQPNMIGMALSRLQKAGRLVSQGEGRTKTWFRAAAAQAQQAA